mmetsp:Transcript_21924/g.40907  ORF Transcript_21924/g.40907 Transcript_21924/m.40907 type:complete len:194 (-) Transcript_21924:545-1126(-)
MHFTPNMIPLSCQFYATLILVSLCFGLVAMCLMLAAIYGIGGAELVLAVVALCLFGLLRTLLPTSLDTHSYHLCDDEKEIHQLAIETFVLQQNEERCTLISPKCVPSLSAKVDDHPLSACSCCPICLHTFETGDEVSIAKCHHAYHSQCLNMWLPKSATCPYCRQNLKYHDEKSPSKPGAWGIFEGIFDSVYS